MCRCWRSPVTKRRQLNTTHQNPHFLPGVVLPEQIRFVAIADADVGGAGLVVYAVPTQAIREVARWVAPRRPSGALQLSLAKGYELHSLKRPTDVIAEETGAAAAALSGPNHAEEVSRDMPSATVIAAADEDAADTLQAAITSDTFRVYTNDDVVGVEFCGAVKNPIAVAVGMSDGLGFGDNSRASLITRSLAEVTRLGIAQGAHIATFTGLAGIGDLIATCTSRHSRNRLAGELLAKGASPAEVEQEVGQVVEGIPTAHALHDLAAHLGHRHAGHRERVPSARGPPHAAGVRRRSHGPRPQEGTTRRLRRRVEVRLGRLVDSPGRESSPRCPALSHWGLARPSYAQPHPCRRLRRAAREASGGMVEKRNYLFTSESVTEGHPDKLADQISDSILDAMLASDPYSRVACETLVTTGLAFVAGEITTETYVDIPKVVRKTVKDVGYTDALYGYDYETCGVMVAIDEQSPDISQGVSQALEVRTDVNDDDVLDSQGAGDQGMMFGYACSETPELMPLPIALAHKLAHRLADVRKAEILPYLRPDGKSQVTVRYEDGRPAEIVKVVLASQHAESADLQSIIYPDLIEHVVEPILPRELYRGRLEDLVVINATGKFVIGGPMGDCGLTGRKIVVDTYGGSAPHGGGAFSGKDPSKVDRSGAYAARYVAKNVVAAGLAERCEVQVAYAIGVAHPVSVMIDCRGTEKVAIATIEKVVKDQFDLRPAAILRDLDLRRPIYRKTAAYGHFGRNDHDFTWERTDKAAALRDAAGLKG